MIINCELRPRRHASPRLLAILGGAAVTAAVAALAAGMLATAAAAGAAASGGWSGPRVLPGPPDSTGGGSFIALSCASRSDCTAVGIYHVRSGRYRLFAVTERRGVWRKALSIAAPVTGRNVNLGGNPVLSCASAGNCAAGDYYWTSSQSGAFVVSEKHGTWGKARKVRSAPTAISCPEPGDCTATLARGYLLNERRGTWRKAFPVPGLAALRHGQPTDFGVITCPSPGNCTAAGSYSDPAVTSRSFVITKRNGIWGSAHPVRSRQGAGLAIAALSCTSAGNCVAGGYTYTLAGGQGAFAVAERHGTWGTAASLPGTLKLGGGIGQLDCPAAGACSAAGLFYAGQQVQPFVSTEQNGTWRSALTITGAGPGPSPALDSLSCRAAGNCVLAGAIAAPGGIQAATAAQVNGRWGPARVLPGVRVLDRGKDSAIDAVSCPARSRCTAVGSFGILVSGHLFVTAQR
jgi:hypothetical protein